MNLSQHTPRQAYEFQKEIKIIHSPYLWEKSWNVYSSFFLRMFSNEFLFPFFGKDGADVSHGGTNMLLHIESY
jgi:hypothetical protein